eukprot:5304854-Amphidinium_carterae.1
MRSSAALRQSAGSASSTLLHSFAQSFGRALILSTLDPWGASMLLAGFISPHPWPFELVSPFVATTLQNQCCHNCAQDQAPTRSKRLCQTGGCSREAPASTWQAASDSVVQLSQNPHALASLAC